jgi:hypothetical protein
MFTRGRGKAFRVQITGIEALASHRAHYYDGNPLRAV